MLNTPNAAAEPPCLESGGRSLRDMAVRAGAWAFALRLTERGLGFARTLILARLLAPADFGKFGIALIALSALEVLSQTGMQQALVHRKGEVGPYLDTVWTVQMLRGLALAAAVFLLAPAVATFFEEPAAAPILRVIAIGFLLQGLTSTGVVQLQKGLEFRGRFQYLVSGSVADLVVSIGAALYFRSAWGLVAGFLAGHLVRAVASYLVHPYRPRLRWNPSHARELYAFGRWLSGSSVIVFLITQGDDVLVGKLLGTSALGLYQMAYLLANLPALQVTHVVSEVAFPVYAKLQGDPAALRAAFLRTLETTALISLPLAAAIAVFSPALVPSVLGAEWSGIVPAMQILAFCGAMRSIGAANGALYQGGGRPRNELITSAIHLGVGALIIYPLTVRWGIAGAAIAVTAPMLLSQGYGIYSVCQMVGCRPRDYVRRIAFPLSGAAVAAATAVWVGNLAPPLAVLIGLPAAILVYLGFLRVAVPGALRLGRYAAGVPGRS